VLSVGDQNCPNGGHQLDFYDIDQAGVSTLVDTKYVCHGMHGRDGAPGLSGKDGPPGLNGKDGPPGLSGAPGQNGRGHRVVRSAYSGPNCPNAGFQLDFYDIDENGASALVDTKYVCHGMHGKDGAPGQQGKDGVPGQNGRGHRMVRSAYSGPNCPNAGFQLDSYDIDENGASSLVDTKYVCHGMNGGNGKDGAPGLQGPPGLNGRDGAQGPKGDQGPPGFASGWHKHFGSASVSSTPVAVLSQDATGAAGYMVDAKVSASYPNNSKSVSCSLTALDSGTGATTTLDSSDALLVGGGTSSPSHTISLTGVYKASSTSATVTVNVNCGTGGDSRTLTNGRVNIFGVNALTIN
jgi:hypothetical protein